MDTHPASGAQLEEAGFEALQRLYQAVVLQPTALGRRPRRAVPRGSELGHVTHVPGPHQLLELCAAVGEVVARRDRGVSASLVTVGAAPGYRDATLVLDCEVIGQDREAAGTARLNWCLGHPDAEYVLQHLAHVQAFAWRQSPTSAPLDAAPGEQRPAWLDRPVAWFT